MRQFNESQRLRLLELQAKGLQLRVNAYQFMDQASATDIAFRQAVEAEVKALGLNPGEIEIDGQTLQLREKATAPSS